MATQEVTPPAERPPDQVKLQNSAKSRAFTNKLVELVNNHNLPYLYAVQQTVDHFLKTPEIYADDLTIRLEPLDMYNLLLGINRNNSLAINHDLLGEIWNDFSTRLVSPLGVDACVPFVSIILKLKYFGGLQSNLENKVISVSSEGVVSDIYGYILSREFSQRFNPKVLYSSIYEVVNLAHIKLLEDPVFKKLELKKSDRSTLVNEPLSTHDILGVLDRYNKLKYPKSQNEQYDQYFHKKKSFIGRALKWTGLRDFGQQISNILSERSFTRKHKKAFREWESKSKN